MSKMNLFKLKYVFLCITAVNSFALDLSEAYQHAITFNAEYLQAKELTLGKQEESLIAKSALLPQINLTSSISQNYIDQPQFNAWYYQPTYGLQLQQTILDFKKMSTYTKQKYQVVMAELQLENAKQQLMIKVVGAYLDVLYAIDVLETTKITKNTLNTQYQAALKSFEQGVVTRTDIADAKAALDNVISEEIAASTTLISRKNAFFKITGCRADNINKLDQYSSFKFESAVGVKEFLNEAKLNNLNLNIANKQIEVALEEIKIAKSGHLPSLNLKAGYQYQDSAGIVATNASSQQLQQATTTPGSPLSSYGVANVGIQLNVPLYSGGGVSAQVRQAQDYYKASKFQQVDVERQIEQDVEDSYWQLYNGASLIYSQKVALDSADLKLKSDTKAYQIGLRNSVDLVNAQMNRYKTSQSYYKAHYEFLQAKIRLAYLTGKLDENYIRIINGYFTES